MVIKIKDLQVTLTETEEQILFKLTNKIENTRIIQGRGMMNAVVIEHDWPEYEPTWQALEQRVDAEFEALAQTNGEKV